MTTHISKTGKRNRQIYGALSTWKVLKSKTAFSIPSIYHNNNINHTHRGQQPEKKKKHISILTPLDDQSISLI